MTLLTLPALTTLASLLVVWFAAIASPGPDLVQIIRVGSRSRSAGLWCALGIMVGNTVWISASLLGLSALISTYPQILIALQLLGGSYLLWMGIGAVRSGWAARRGARTAPRLAGGDAATLSRGQSLWLGVTTNLANPKAVLFFGAVFAQFIRPDMGVAWTAVIAVVLIATGLVWFLGFAVAVQRLAVGLVRNAALIDIATGVIFLGLAVFMLVEGSQGALSYFRAEG